MGAKHINSEWKNGALAFTTTAKNIETLTLIPKKTGCGNADLIRSMWTPSPEIATIYYEDFLVAPVTATNVLNGFTVTQHATTASIALIDTAGGEIRLHDLQGAEDSGVQIQHKHEWVKPASGKDIWFEARVKIRDVDKTGMFVGLATTDTTIIGSAPDNAIGFWMVDGDATLFFETSAGTATPVNVATDLADGVYARLAFYVDSNSHVHAYVNDVDVTLPTKTSWALNDIPATELAPAICFKSHVASTTSHLTLDYVKVIQLR